MTLDDVYHTLDLISRLWPNATWAVEVQQEVARRITRFSISYEQAKASLVNLRIGLKWDTIKPCEILEAMASACPEVEPQNAHLRLEELATLGHLLENNPALRDWLGERWLALQGHKFNHWKPQYLTDPKDPSRGYWSRVFLTWAKRELDRMERDGGMKCGP